MNKEARITLRLSVQEKENLRMQSYIARVSVSELIRKKIHGLQIVSKVDKMVLNEMRRQGGLLKNNFSTLLKSDLTNDEKGKLIAHQEETLRGMNALVDAIAKSYNTEQK